MKVKELIGRLKELDQEALIILAEDSEGNNYSPLIHNTKDIDDNQVYEEYSKFSGNVWHLNLTADDNCMSKDEWIECKKHNPKCVVLYPLR